MKKIWIVLILGIMFSAHANSEKELDTIYANERMTMALFFPSNIKQGITGSDNFVFTYNRERGQNLGLLKAVEGQNSNLLVITNDGSIYSFIISYAKKLEYPNRFVDIQERIGTERHGIAKNTPEEQSTPEESPKSKERRTKTNAKLKKACKSLLELPERKDITAKRQGLSFGVKNLYHFDDRVYIQFDIRNGSDMDFNFGELKLYKINGKRGRKASYQELELMPVYRYNVPNKIVRGQKTRFVYVLPKFALDKNEKLVAQLFEYDTSRSVSLKFK